MYFSSRLRQIQTRCHTALLLVALLAPTTPSWAQSLSPTDPAAQEFLRQQERERLLRQQQEHTPDVHLPEPPTSADPGRLLAQETPCFPIERVVLVGAMAAKFQWAVAAANRSDDGTPDPALKRCLGARSIGVVMHRVQNAIVHRGYVTTRVLAEPQDLRLGTLQLSLIPGRVRTIALAPDTDVRATTWNAVPAAPGDLLNLRDIEQALENFKRLPTVEADVQVTPTQAANGQPGESDLVIQWKQDFPARMNFTVDDSGSRATGKVQGSLTTSYDHLWTLNDLFYFSLNQDLGGASGPSGNRGVTVHYSLPWDYWLLGGTRSSSRYHQAVAGAIQTYIYSGKSQNLELKLSRLVYRDTVRKTTLSMRGWARLSSNAIDDTEIGVQRRRVAGWELGVNQREFIGANTLEVNLAYRRGTGFMNSVAAPEEGKGKGTARPKIVLADAQLNVPLAWGEQRLRYSASGRAQWGRTPLVPQDRFAIGGRSTVRGFDGETLLSADHGWLLRNDLAWTLTSVGAEAYAGVDHGEVGGPSSVDLVGKRLSGAALGLRGAYKGLGYDLFIGVPLAKPSGLEAASGVGGFSLSWSL